MRKILLLAVFLALPAVALLAGLRGPGEYHGVVLFDRWDGCTLYSGVYVMYAADRLKETLRPYAGKAVVLDAAEVEQPINPGDGLMRQFTVVGEPEPARAEQVELGASFQIDEKACPTLRLVVFNRGPEVASISTDALAFTVFAKHPPPDKSFFIAADGPSYAIVTRWSFSLGSHPFTSNRLGAPRIGWSVREQEGKKSVYRLDVGERKAFVVDLEMDPGEYDCIFGYGGGVHASLCTASNFVALDVSPAGIFTSPTIARR